MVCDCINNNVIKFVKGTSFYIKFSFNEDISIYTNAEFIISKNYGITPVLNKTIPVTEANTITFEITVDDTNLFNDFENGKNSASYIWGLDLFDSSNRINVFPKTGEAAPLCIVYKHV